MVYVATTDSNCGIMSSHTNTDTNIMCDSNYDMTATGIRALTGTRTLNVLIRTNNLEETTNYYSLGETTTNYTDYYNCTTNENFSYVSFGWHKKNPLTRMSEIIRSRHCPAIHTKMKYLSPAEERERRARETLRIIVGEEQYRNFLKRGFVTVQCNSGYTYQIFHRAHALTHVWKNGKCVERLCIYLKGSFPPTDFVITLYLMLLNNEKRVWKIGNKNGPLRRNKQMKQLTLQPLSEIFADLKRSA